MKKPIIHFAHANGFPAKTYNKLFSFLTDEFEIGFIERQAHNKCFPVDDGWVYLKEELRQEIEKHYSEKVIGIGHSFGGILHFLLAIERPELYKQIILLDAPLISRLTSVAVKILKTTGLMRRTALSRQTIYRRNFWKSKADAFRHFHAKEKFRAFDEEVLLDYIEYGTVETESGVKLFFEPRIESKIYRTLPHNFSKYRGKLKVPATYVGGSNSREARLARLNFMKKNFPIDFYLLEGSHLFPLEKPEETAQIIKSILSKQPYSK